MDSFKFDPNRLHTLRELEKGMDEKIVDVLVQHFMENTPLALKKMSDSLSAQDLDLVAREAHKLKSGCGNLGLVSLALIFGTIERLASTHETQKCLLFLEEAQGQFEYSKTLLKAS